MTLHRPPRRKPQRYVNAALRWGLLLLLISCGEKRDEGASRLADSESPYLREHADNPVNWYEWSDEAFERAAKENKPVIVSIGYASCHWCHVMEDESFMDPEVARIMNENFISIKVDREERPDVDQQFIYASQALTGTAGWPLNAFALSDGKPFHTITYYPKDQWIDLLNRVAAAWKDDSGKLKKQAADLTKNIKPFFEYKNPDSVLRLDLKAFINHVPTIQLELDFNYGGLKGAPKFPMPSLIEFMLQYSYMKKDTIPWNWVKTTLNGMHHGGIYDQIGSGFGRYSTDSLWHVPHFEKMLYDNALLLSAYSNAYKATKIDAYLRVVHDLQSFIKREMTIDDSVFVASINADSEGEEGKYYMWTADQFKSVLGKDAERAMKYYHIKSTGEHVPRRTFGHVDFSNGDMFDSINQKLREERKKRIHPESDRKIITSWNAMMIIGFLDARSFNNNAPLAYRAASFLEKHMVKDDRVYRNMLYGGKPTIEGFLDDYAWLAKAYIKMYQYDFNIEQLNKARKIADLAIEKFKDPNSPFFFYSAGTKDNKVIRNIELFDQAIPSSNSVFAEVLLMLGEYYQEPRYTKLAEAAITEMISSLDIDISSISNWARLAQIVDFGYYEIAVVGSASTNAHVLDFEYLPATIMMGGPTENLPLLENKLVEGQTTIYVCRNRICKLPTTDGNVAVGLIVYK
ncbi:MAG TPA: thioredoxin domain-containing protein [Cyclobacteriaceae bacterium]|nr:thioredoxin domain-containing protein [Cyclobacteriaceae bacterium]